MMLSVQDLVKSYQGKTVLDLPALTFELGKITAVIGPSGAGKSTLLTLLNGLEPPDAGRILLDGEGITASSNGYRQELQNRMAMVFQKPVMFNTTVEKNIAFGLRIRKLPAKEIQKRVEEAAAWLGLSDLLKQKALTLSGGEAGRVSLARALVIRPEVLLLDEPTASLDPANVTLIEEVIRKASREYSTTVVLVTHNMFQARRLADRVVCLMEGQLVESGPAEQVFGNPKDGRTGAFVNGTMIY